MSFSHWLRKPAVKRPLSVAFLGVAALLVITWLWPDEPSYPQRQTLEAVDAFLDADCVKLLANKALSAAVPRQAEECADKTAAQKKGYRDLAQSVRASNAAEESAWLSYQQARIALVGAALLVLTLGATAWAASAAADAAEIADKGAGAAIKAAETADATVRNERAWLTHGELVVTQIHDAATQVVTGYAFSVSWENTGRTPAINCVGYIQYDSAAPTIDGDAYTYTGPMRAFPLTNAGPNRDLKLVRPMSVIGADMLESR